MLFNLVKRTLVFQRPRGEFPIQCPTNSFLRCKCRKNGENFPVGNLNISHISPFVSPIFVEFVKIAPFVRLLLRYYNAQELTFFRSSKRRFFIRRASFFAYAPDNRILYTWKSRILPGAPKSISRRTGSSFPRRKRTAQIQTDARSKW